MSQQVIRFTISSLTQVDVPGVLLFSVDEFKSSSFAAVLLL